MHESTILQYRGADGGYRDRHQNPLQRLGPSGARGLGGTQPHFDIEVGGAEERGAGQLTAVGGDAALMPVVPATRR